MIVNYDIIEYEYVRADYDIGIEMALPRNGTAMGRTEAVRFLKAELKRADVTYGEFARLASIETDLKKQRLRSRTSWPVPAMSAHFLLASLGGNRCSGTSRLEDI